MTKHSIYFFIVTSLFIISIFILQGKVFASYFSSNIGWQQFAVGLTQTTHDTDAAIPLFLSAISASDQNQRAYWGAGRVYAHNLDENNASDVWHAGQIPSDLLNQYGVFINSNGQSDEALIYYRSAHKFDASQPTQGYLRSGQVCQQHLPNFDALSIKNREYCLDYFTTDAGDLILDGQFNGEIDWSWTGSFSFPNPNRATVDRDQNSGMPAPSLVLTGLTPDRHAGLYQRIPMEPGTTVRFSGHFRTENQGSLAAWLLYIGWRQDGRSQGNYAAIADNTFGWDYLTREFTLPEGSEPWVQFYPALLIGQGTVWSDNISIEILRK